MGVGQARRQAQVRLFALDLDGALLRSDGSVSPRTRRALRTAQGHGLGVALVTSRAPLRARRIAGELGLTGIAICGSGSTVYDLATSELVRDHRLRADHASLLVECLRTAVPEVAFAVEMGASHACEASFTLAPHYSEELDSPLNPDDALQLCRQGVTKLFVQQPDWPLIELFNLTHAFAAGRATVAYHAPDLIEVSAPGISRTHTLAVHCLERGILAEEVLAFGDKRSDLPMLRWAGCGIAVANAHPELLAAADIVTRSSDADGVALALERLGYA
jgi:Cof subfamily protein (haloacid dehalogenase superfamily)